MNLADWPERTEKLLKPLGYSYRQPKALSEAILRLSDHYQAQTKITPWREKWAQAAYLAYFLPLNFFRLQALFTEAGAFGFWPPEAAVIDFGAGPAVAALALSGATAEIAGYHAIERSSQGERLFKQFGLATGFPVQWAGTFSPETVTENSVGLFSYSLNELERMPAWLENLPALMIMEPSTHQAGRRLLELREQLIAKGFYAWAPCLHQQSCPLLRHSKKDWCHHRIDWPMPEWFAAIDRQLPIKNQTLTYSYLLMSRTPPPTFPPGTFRLTGDLQEEKGKYKVMACRGDNREFLSWLKKEKHVPKVKRGQLVEVKNESENSDEKQSEVRPGSDYRVLQSLLTSLRL